MIKRRLEPINKILKQPKARIRNCSEVSHSREKNNEYMKENNKENVRDCQLSPKLICPPKSKLCNPPLAPNQMDIEVIPPINCTIIPSPLLPRTLYHFDKMINMNISKLEVRVNDNSRKPLFEVNNNLSTRGVIRREIVRSASQVDLRDLVTSRKKPESITIDSELEEIYMKNYLETFEAAFQNSKGESFNCLKDHQIKACLRAKLTDWMLEVFSAYKNSTSICTYFRAIAIFDSFLLVAPITLADSDVHLLGVASMLIATKTEDIYPIPVSDFVTKVCHNKFSRMEIVQKEWEILTNLKFNIICPTIYDYSQLLIKKMGVFKNLNHSKKTFVTKTNGYILKMLTAHAPNVPFAQKTIALGGLSVVLEIYYGFLFDKFSSSPEDLCLIRQDYEEWMLALYKEGPIAETNECVMMINELLKNFDTWYPDNKNIKLENFANL